MNTRVSTSKTHGSMHGLGVACGLAAGVWLGGAEAPTKLVNVGISPFAVSLAMVLGVFVARWTLPTLLKGTDYVFNDLFAKPHLIVWAVLAGALWAVANTLTVFAIRDVGLAIAFPLWNANSLIGIFWGWLLFQEMRGAGFRIGGRVLGGALANCLRRDSSRICNRAAYKYGACAGRARNHGRAWCKPAVGNDVCALPEGVFERNESIVLRHRIHHR